MNYKLLLGLAICSAMIVAMILGFAKIISGIAPEIGDPADCLYAEAEMVEAVVNGQTGQVTSVSNRDGECRYWVRFAVPQAHTAGGFLFSGGPVRQEPLTRIRMEEFELRSAQ